MGLGAGLNKEKKVSRALASISLCFLLVDASCSATMPSPLKPQRESQNKPFLQLLLRAFVTAARRQTNTGPNLIVTGVNCI